MLFPYFSRCFHLILHCKKVRTHSSTQIPSVVIDFPSAAEFSNLWGGGRFSTGHVYFLGMDFLLHGQ